jgi:hypothetical protein
MNLKTVGDKSDRDLVKEYKRYARRDSDALVSEHRIRKAYNFMSGKITCAVNFLWILVERSKSAKQRQKEASTNLLMAITIEKLFL